MKVKILRGYLNKLPPDFDDKEVTFFDYKKGTVYDTPNTVYVCDESDSNYLDLIFNYDESEV